MNASSTLLAALTPTIAELETRFSDPGASSGRLASADSFLSLMSQGRHDKIAVGPEDAKILQSTVPEAGAPAAHVNTSVASSRIAVMVHPPAAASITAASVSPSAQAVKPRVISQTVQLPVAQASATLKNSLPVAEESSAPIQDDEPSAHKFNKPASTPVETLKKNQVVAPSQTPPATPPPAVAETPAPSDSILSMLVTAQLSALGFDKSDFSLVKTNIVEARVETKPAVITRATTTAKPGASSDSLTAQTLQTKRTAITKTASAEKPGTSVKTVQPGSGAPAILSTPQTSRPKSKIDRPAPLSNQAAVTIQPTIRRNETHEPDTTAPDDARAAQNSPPPGTHSRIDPTVAVPVSTIPTPALAGVRSAAGPDELHPLAVTPMADSSNNAALPALAISSGKMVAPLMADLSSNAAVSPRAEPSSKMAAANNSVSNTQSSESSQLPAGVPEIHKPRVTTNDAAAPVASTPLPAGKREDMPLAIKANDHATAKSVEPTKGPTAKTPEPVLSLSDPVKTAATAMVSPASSNDGTGGAFTSYRMDFSAEKNEIAEPATQKVPGTSPKEASSAKAGNALPSLADSTRPAAKTATVDSPQVINLADKTGDRTLDLGKGVAVAPAVAQSATQIERLGQMVNQHVTMMHQSGANNMAVSLKLDPQTELNLQLTNHNGQIEASVSVGRGTVTGLDGHWKELQESLARQNVQLLPLENKAAARTPSFNAGSNSDSSSSSTFKQPSQNSQRHNRDAQPNLPLSREAVAVSPTDKTPARTASRPGWESWA